MMRFEDLLAFADDQTLQELIGQPVVRLLRLLDPKLASPSRLRELILDLRTPEDLLRDNPTRQELFSLLPLAAARELAETLGRGSEADPYRALNRIRVRSGSTNESALFQFFGIKKVAKMKESERPAQGVSEPEYGLFPHQRKAVREVARLLKTGSRRALLHMPTGAGKTRTALNVICDHLRVNEPTTVIWLAYSEELCEQAASEFEVAWHKLGNRPLDVYRFWGDRDLKLEAVSDGFMVAGLGKVYSAAKQSIRWLATLADAVSLVIIDEAHQAVAESYSLILNGIEAKRRDTALLGLTATPGRTWNDLDEDERLARFFARQKVTLKIEGVSNPVEYLIECGYLARPKFANLNHSGTLDLAPKDQRELAEALEIPGKVLRQLADDEQRNLAIVRRVENLARHHLRILVFATTVDHANLLSVVLKARGTEAHAVTSATSGSQRRRVIEEYLAPGDSPVVLCNYGVLTTGFDAPRTSAVVIARPTKSLVLYSQMLGRGLRGPKAGGNEEAEVVTVVDPSLPGFGDLGEAFLNWEDVW